VHLKGDDQVLTVKPQDTELVAVGADVGKVLLFPVEKVPVLAGPGQGVRMMRLTAKGEVVAMELVSLQDRLVLRPRKGKDVNLPVMSMPIASRGTQGKSYCKTIEAMERFTATEALE
jgi:DNA gyrase/topoisomerase IV subunit A